ncbi:Structural maintenance of chromosomes protein 3 [Tilletia horrida]|uniref:Structural maintenance of chromosomes protein 3 n=1 Tax=Tilletia horrida TaxID=155126 RepID=A0AAN6JYT8_9BASI|nr:Structural maintenance of chromosomes protein 3 [Tilletia horrida]KAK0554110.1 Structural maintenance of chromosomes protein 3 [Tilletia horrida]
MEDVAYPPAQISIRGTSGPYWLLISNLMKGTSADDIRMTFEPFGNVLDVRLRPPPTANHPSSSFEIAFESRADAAKAREQFNGALADGRVLSVDFIQGGSHVVAGAAAGTGAGSGSRAIDSSHSHNPTGTTESSVPYAQFSRSVSQAAQDRKTGPRGEVVPGPAPLPREVRGLPSGNGARAGTRDLIPARETRGGGRNGVAAAAVPTARAVSGQKRKASGSSVAASAPTPAKQQSLQSRLMGPAEAARAQKVAQQQKAAQQKQAAAAARKRAVNQNAAAASSGPSFGALGTVAKRSGGVIPTAPKGKAAVALSLKDRIGSLPLAQRLAAADAKPGKGAKSEIVLAAAAAPKKKRQRKGKTAASGSSKASSMEVD